MTTRETQTGAQKPAGTGQGAAAAAWAETNPFAKPSPLPFQAPSFDKIKDSDYQPAIEEGMRRQLAEVEVIANNPEAPTFANTIEALEQSGTLLERVENVFLGMVGSNTNPTIQEVQSEEAPKQAAHTDAILLNAKLFARVRAIYETRGTLQLAPDAKYLVERYYRDFVRAGALLSEADKEKVRALNKEQAQLADKFRNKVLAGTNAAALVISDKAELDGLPETDIAAASEAATKLGHAGKWVITLQNTTQQPAQTYLKNRGVRERLFNASSKRCNNGGENDTNAIVERLAQLSAEKAKVLGYATYAAYALDDEMAKTPQNAIKLMTDVSPAATAKAREEASRMQALIDKANSGLRLEPWDWQYYAEQVRKAEYDLDESAIRPYFAARRRILCGEPVIRAHLQGTEGHSGIPGGCAGVRGIRRRRNITGAVLRGFFRPAKQARRSVDKRVCKPEQIAGNEAGDNERGELRKAGAGTADAPEFRASDDDVPRVRARAAEHDVGRTVSEQPDARGLRRSAIAVQRALGVGAVGICELCQAF